MPASPLHNPVSNTVTRIAAALVLLAALTLTLVSPAHALPARDRDKDNDDGGLPRCIDDLRLNSFSATPNELSYAQLGQPITLAWDVEVPANCGHLEFRIDRTPVDPTGTQTIIPQASRTYELKVNLSNKWFSSLGTAQVSVKLPPRCPKPVASPTIASAPTRKPIFERPCGEVIIGASNMGALFRQAIATENTAVRVADHVRLDLSGFQWLSIASDVLLIGGRTPQHPGPLIFSKKRPPALFEITGDDVRITGLRIKGPDMGEPSGKSKLGVGIATNSNRGIEIDNNELSGWTNSAVSIRDKENDADEVHVHDNFIHHNQHVGTMGYGIAVKDDASALIERNVFDYNRHAIESDGSNYAGYRAHSNLVLQNGGRHKWGYHTHQFDMHGQGHCGVRAIVYKSLFNCGTAGLSVDIRYNSFLYTADNAVKIRGVPRAFSSVSDNVFAHDDLDDAVQPDDEPRVGRRGNTLGVDSFKTRLACDIDRDGRIDWFLATGRTWWYSSRKGGDWTFMRQSRLRPGLCP